MDVLHPMIRHLILASLLAASAWAESFEEMQAKTDMADAESVYTLARWCADNRQPTKAQQLYAKVVKIDPQHQGARTARGEVLVGDRWVAKQFAPKAAGGSARPGDGGGKTSVAGPGPAAKDVAWELSLPKDPNPVQNDFIDGLIERMRTAENDGDSMGRAAATLVRADNWPTAFPRLCAALAKPGFGDVYGACDIILELRKQQKFREIRRLYPFVAKATEGITDAGDLEHFAMVSVLVRDRKAVPRLGELLAHPNAGVQGGAKEALSAITRLPAKDLTPEKVKAWWDANWSASEDQVLLEQLRSSDPAIAVEAAVGLCELRNKEIFPVLFKLLRGDDPAVIKRSIDTIRRATTLDWGLEVGQTPEARGKRVDLLEKWWKEEGSKFAWPGLPADDGSSDAAGAQPADPDRDACNNLASTTGTEAQAAEVHLRNRGTKAMPALLDGLANANPLIRRRAHDILRESTKQDFAFDPRAEDAKRQIAIDAWMAWAIAQKLVVDPDAADVKADEPGK